MKTTEEIKQYLRVADICALRGDYATAIVRTTAAMTALAERLDAASAAAAVNNPRRSYVHNDKRQGWDWTKTNSALASEHGCNYNTVAKARYTLGKQRVTKWSGLATGGWDWKLPNAELARLNKVPIAVVAAKRTAAGAPVPEWLRRTKAEEQKVPRYDVDWSAADWEKPDVVISREVGCTRELVRQNRAKLGKPKRLFYNQKYDRFVKLLDGRKAVESHSVKEFGLSRRTLVCYCARAGVRYVTTFRREVDKLKTPYHLMDWRLPNLVLERLWGTTPNGVGCYRHVHGKPHASRAWAPGSCPDQWRAAVAAQEAAAAAWKAAKNGAQ